MNWRMHIIKEPTGLWAEVWIKEAYQAFFQAGFLVINTDTGKVTFQKRKPRKK